MRGYQSSSFLELRKTEPWQDFSIAVCLARIFAYF